MRGTALHWIAPAPARFNVGTARRQAQAYTSSSLRHTPRGVPQFQGGAELSSSNTCAAAWQSAIPINWFEGGSQSPPHAS